MTQATRRGKGGRPALLLAVVLAVVVSCSVVLLTFEKSAEASFPGKNGKIAFTSPQDGDYEIYKMNPDGSQLKQVTHKAAGDVGPSWSSEGSKLAFSRDYWSSAKEAGIFVKDITTGGTLQLSDPNDSMEDRLPAWSPDGSQVAFWSGFNIWVMNTDGSERKQRTINWVVSGTQVNQTGPAWSPDGSKIAFATECSGAGCPEVGANDIWVMNSDGTNQLALTKTGDDITQIYESAPTWSPDGSKIAFERRAANRIGSEIWVMNADGSEMKPLTNTFVWEQSVADPAWSPNGLKIAFERGSDIWVMNAADGTNQRNTTNTSWIEQEPDWQPIPQATP